MESSPTRRVRRRRPVPWIWIIVGLMVFVLGTGAGWALFLRDDGGTAPESGSASLEPSEPEGNEAGPDDDLDADAGDLESTEDTATPEEIMADVVALNSAPSEPADDEPARTATYLASTFDATLAPANLQDLRRVAAPAVTASMVTADYRGQGGGPVDLVRLSVERFADTSAADAAVTAALEQFPASQITYPWSDRTIMQGATQEDHPEAYPPALVFVWRDGVHVVTVMVAPVAPAQAQGARAAVLDAIGTLPY